ncbi:DUF6471 domain-containing protein [Paraburkholderia pallida]|uniref:DUF6471 domain-containing protein n=1 Tax=Paraburkholderia pallida TaxID=2547399 RepID=UPI003AB532F5
MATDFHDEARAIIRREMESQGVTFGELSDLLMHFGLKENQACLYQKIWRGTFQAAFFLQCLSAIRMKGGVNSEDARRVELELPSFETAKTSIDENKLALDRRRKASGALGRRNAEPGTPRRPRGRPRAASTGETTDIAPPAPTNSRRQKKGN